MDQGIPWLSSGLRNYEWVLEVGFLPGVTMLGLYLKERWALNQIKINPTDVSRLAAG